MKPASFFIGKANEYKEIISDLKSNYVENTGGWDYSPEYAAQSDKISDVLTKVTLMFIEFDKGELFQERKKNIDSNETLKWDTPKKIEQYISLLNLFIEHIETYRVPEISNN